MTGRRAFVLQVLAGPAAFGVVRAVPLAGLGPEAHFTLAVYAWTLAWWATIPVPWAVTAFLPFVLLPAGGAMPFAEVAGLYGQTILPFLVGVMLVGHALRKHGLAVRISLAILSIPGVARSNGSLLFVLLIASTVISALVNDLTVIVTMTPIALSLMRSAVAALDAGGPPQAATGAPRMAAAARRRVWRFCTARPPAGWRPPGPACSTR